MNEPYDDADEVGVDFEAGRRSVDGTWSPDWVDLSGCSAMAAKLYRLMRMRLNRKRRDSKVWPGGATLAVMLGLERSDSVSRYTKELQELGAIDIRGERMPRRNVYIVHDIPPPGYEGPLSLEEWDADPDNRLKIAAIKRAEREKRERARVKRGGVKPQVSLDTADSRYQEPAGSGTGKSRYQGTGENRCHGPADSRDHSLSEPHRNEPSSPQPPGDGSPPVDGRAGWTEVEEPSPTGEPPMEMAGAVLDAVVERNLTRRARAPRGKPRADLVGMIAAALGRGWGPADLVLAASGPLDDARNVFGALRYRLAELGPPPAPAGTGAGAKSGVSEWCGECADPGYRWVLDADDRPVERCPRCHPAAASPKR